jgi:hypothetical protein
LTVSVQTKQKVSLEQIRGFLESSQAVEFQARNRSERYAWVEETLRQQNWKKLNRAGKGLVRRYIAKMTGLSRAHVTRLITHYT